MADYESVLCVKNEVFVYRIPARTSNRGYRAAEWKLDEPDWTGRLKVVSKGSDLSVRLEDKNSGELFAQCPIESYPSAAVEQVLDSSRYFVLRIQDGSGRAAFIGLGFADRGDSFDLLVSLQDHFKQVKREEANKYEEKSGVSQLDAGPKLDLSFKDGQTIKINIATKKSGESTVPLAGASKQRPRGPTVGASPLLPPPPGAGTRVAALPKPSPVSSLQEQSWGSSGVVSQPVASLGGGALVHPTTARENNDLLVDFGLSSLSFQATSGSDPFSGNLEGVRKPASQPAKVQSVLDQNWVNFD